MLFEFVEKEAEKSYAEQVLQVFYLIAGKTADGHRVMLVPKEQLEGSVATYLMISRTLFYELRRYQGTV
jgi:hypothetical protein